LIWHYKRKENIDGVNFGERIKQTKAERNKKIPALRFRKTGKLAAE
jgi:hypothetical protein